MKILAFDLGTLCGWATNIDGVGYSYGTLNLKPGRYFGGGMRYVLFGNALTDLLNHCPELVVFEEVRRHAGVDAAHVYGGLMAVLTGQCEFRKIPYQGVPVGTIKKHATGKGNASKEQMIEAASNLVTWMAPLKNFTDDEADAICLLNYALKAFGGSSATISTSTRRTDGEIKTGIHEELKGGARAGGDRQAGDRDGGPARRARPRGE